jgi:general secretion pathway protein C
VYTDRVLLDRNGAIEALMLPHKFAGTGPAPRGTHGPSTLDSVQPGLPNESAMMSEVLRPQAVFIEGKLRGYRVYPGARGGGATVFTKAGLRNGDIVIAINGTTLDDPARGNDIFNSLGNSDQARVTVMRNGQQQDIGLNLSPIAN